MPAVILSILFLSGTLRQGRRVQSHTFLAIPAPSEPTSAAECYTLHMHTQCPYPQPNSDLPWMLARRSLPPKSLRLQPLPIVTSWKRSDRATPGRKQSHGLDTLHFLNNLDTLDSCLHIMLSSCSLHALPPFPLLRHLQQRLSIASTQTVRALHVDKTNMTLARITMRRVPF
jgi:hypothetical protein